MIDRHIIKITPSVSQNDLLKRLEKMKGFDPQEMWKLHLLKVKVEVICEPEDAKKLTEVLKEPSKDNSLSHFLRV